MKHKCGHDGLADRFLGRGQARVRRMEAIAAVDCRMCVRHRTAARLTHLDGTPYTAEERQAYVAK